MVFVMSGCGCGKSDMEFILVHRKTRWSYLVVETLSEKIQLNLQDS